MQLISNQLLWEVFADLRLEKSEYVPKKYKMSKVYFWQF